MSEDSDNANTIQKKERVRTKKNYTVVVRRLYHRNILIDSPSLSGNGCLFRTRVSLSLAST